MADSTIDQQIKYAQQVVSRAFDNDLVGGNTLKAFKRVNMLLKKGANKRDVKEPRTPKTASPVIFPFAVTLRQY
jgi:hypothetical protein